MKQIIGIWFIIVVGIYITSVSVWAQTATDSGTSQQSSYELPYPGLLPDSPFYFIKAARDRIVSILINSPTKKVEFFLLNSDKRVRAGAILFEKKKYDIALDTISKSNNYLDEAIAINIDAKKKGYDTAGLFGKMNSATGEHIRVLNNLQKHDSDVQVKQALELELKRLKTFEKKITPYIP